MSTLDDLFNHLLDTFDFVDQSYTLTTGDDGLLQISLLKGLLSHLAADHCQEFFQWGSPLLHGKRLSAALFLITLAAFRMERWMTMVSVSLALTNHSLMRGWAGHSWVATNRVPITTPSAPRARAARNPLASAIPPPAMIGIRTNRNPRNENQ